MEPLKGIRITVDTGAIEYNVASLKKKYPSYDYFMAVVKGNAYGHGLCREVVSAIIKGGAEYLCVCYLEEALKIRRDFGFKDIPVLCLNPASANEAEICKKHNIAVTVAGRRCAEAISAADNSGLKVHIKIDSGLGRFGLTGREQFKKVCSTLKSSGAEIEGIYTHLVSEGDVALMQKQIDIFREIISGIDISEVPIIHVPSGEAMTLLPPSDFINGTRVGSAVYGLIGDGVPVRSAMRVTTDVLSVRRVRKGDLMGYCNNYVAPEDGYAAFIPVGYSNGFLRSYGRHHSVIINGRRQKMIGGIYMCQCCVSCDEHTKPGNEVVLFEDFDHFYELAAAVGTIPEEIILALRPAEIIYK